ncbi:MAG: ABC transporter permease [Lysobacterales bacterium]
MFQQIFEITWMNLRNLPERLGASLVIVVGLAGVVGVLTALLAMSEGLGSTLKATGSAERAIVLRGGSDAELNSGLDPDSANLIAEQAGVRKGSDGKPLASRELVLIAELPLKRSGSSGNVTLRGVEPAGFELRPELKIIAGRKFEPGLNEMMVGKGVAGQFEGAELGKVVRIRGADWTIVGVFESGNVHDSELWIDTATAQSAFGRGGYSLVLVALENAAALTGFQAALKADRRLNVDAESQVGYYAKQSGESTAMIRVLTLIVSVVMAFGAIFAALNTMYASVSTRTKEIATLRAIGFGPAPVVVSVLIESMLLALVGGLIGAAVAWLLFNNYAVTTLGAGFTQVVFNFRVTPELLRSGIGLALAIGFMGGLLPALSAARMPVTTALRAA